MSVLLLEAQQVQKHTLYMPKKLEISDWRWNLRPEE